MKDLLIQLSEVLERIITKEDLEGKTEKQIWYLKALCENILKPNYSAFYYKGAEESTKIIKNILGIHSEFVDKKQAYLKIKFK